MQIHEVHKAVVDVLSVQRFPAVLEEDVGVGVKCIGKFSWEAIVLGDLNLIA